MQEARKVSKKGIDIIGIHELTGWDKKSTTRRRRNHYLLWKDDNNHREEVDISMSKKKKTVGALILWVDPHQPKNN